MKNIYIKILNSVNLLEELEHEKNKVEKKSNWQNWILGGIVGAIISAAVAVALKIFGLDT